MVQGADELSRRVAELERLLGTIQSISHVGSWEWDIASGEIRWSDELYRIYGVEPGSVTVTLEYFLSRIHPDERDRIRREIQAVLRHAGPFTYRELIVWPDGSLHTLDTVGEALADSHGTVVKLVGTCRDVTDVVSRDERLGFYADVFEHVQVGLSGWQLDRSGPEPRLRLVAFNAKTEALVGVPLAGKLGARIADLLPVLEGSPLLADARAMTPDSRIRRYPPFARSSAPAAPWLAATLFPLPGRHVGLALEDVTEQIRAQLLHDAERQALEMLAAGAPLGAILAVLVEGIEQVSPGVIASVLLVDASGTRLEHGAAPHLPDAYNRLLEGLPIGPRAGSCGTAIYRRARVIVRDIETDPLWQDYRELAAAHGLRACWSNPILAADGRVLGAFALYHREPSEPDEASFALLARAAHVTGIVLERRLLDDQMRALAARLEAAREDERTAIAREIHDELGQSLTVHKLEIGWLLRRATDAQVTSKLEEMSRSTDDIIRAVQRIAADLRPGLLDQLGLRAAIEWQAEEFQRRTGIPCAVTSSISNVQLDRELATNVFRIFQEALTNVARHAQARHVDVSLTLHQGNVHLKITDDGVGVPEIAPRASTLGILGMRERASRFGGECTVKRRDPRGTIVSVIVPQRYPAIAAP